jgi:hypothetical protein
METDSSHRLAQWSLYNDMVVRKEVKDEAYKGGGFASAPPTPAGNEVATKRERVMHGKEGATPSDRVGIPCFVDRNHANGRCPTRDGDMARQEENGKRENLSQVVPSHFGNLPHENNRRG